MGQSLAPERFHRLQVCLDRVRRSTEHCRGALLDLADGKLTQEEYDRLLAEHREAQQAWQRAWQRSREDHLADA